MLDQKLSCIFFCIYHRLKAGLKLHEEAEKREVERSIHLLQDPEGMLCKKYITIIRVVVLFSPAVGKKVQEAQRQRQAASIPKAMEMETAD